MIFLVVFLQCQPVFCQDHLHVVVHLVVQDGHRAGIVAIEGSRILIVGAPSQVPVLVQDEDILRGKLLIQLKIGLQTAEEGLYLLRTGKDEFPLPHVHQARDIFLKLRCLGLRAFRNDDQQLEVPELEIAIIDLLREVLGVSCIVQRLFAKESEDGDVLLKRNAAALKGPEVIEGVNFLGQGGEFCKIVYPGSEKEIGHNGECKEHDYNKNFLHDAVP